MGNTFFFEWEKALMLALQQHGSGWEWLSVLFTAFGENAIMLAVIGIFYWGIDKRRGVRIAVNFATGIILGSMIKNVFLRRRPYMDIEEIQALRLPEPGAHPHDIAAQGYSFPSLHATDTMTIFGSVFAETKRVWLRVLCGIMILMVGLSRALVGVHFPTDILAGWGIGLAAILVMNAVQEKVKSTPKVLLGLLVLTLPGWFFCTSEDFYSSYGMILGILAGAWFEERFVRFENTKHVPTVLLRTVGGLVVFALVSEGLKLLLPGAWQEGVTLCAHIVRSGRYALSLFAAVGVYPMVFGIRKKIVKKA